MSDCPPSGAGASRTTCGSSWPKRITGVEVEVGDSCDCWWRHSAVTLSLGWPDYSGTSSRKSALPAGLRPRLGFEDKDLAGQAHPWGTVILSVPSLYEASRTTTPTVGLHEFAHLLDVEQTRFDGIPVGLGRRRREWVAGREEMERLRKEVGPRPVAPKARSSSWPWPWRPSSSASRPPPTPSRAVRVLRDYFGRDPQPGTMRGACL